MAGNACNTAFWPWINGLFSNWMCKRGMLFVAAGTQVKLISLEKESEIRPMRTMAISTFPFNNRWVLVLIFFIAHGYKCISMTFIAYFCLFIFFQMIFIRSMRVMAVNAKNAMPHMCVDLSKILFNRFMAGSANRHTIAFDLQRVFWLCCIMAFSALLFCKRFMRILLDQPIVVRPMWIVAGYAFCILHRIITVSFFRLFIIHPIIHQMAPSAYLYGTLF